MLNIMSSSMINKMTGLNEMNSNLQNDAEKSPLVDSHMFDDSEPFDRSSVAYDNDMTDGGYHGDHHSDYNDVSERNSKSSRRKQSKPSRVKHVDVPGELPAANPKLSIENEESALNLRLEKPNENIPKLEQSDSVQRSFSGDSGYVEPDQNINCDLCPESFSSHNALKDHMCNTHFRMMPKESPSPTMYPTAYHRLGSQLHPENITSPSLSFPGEMESPKPNLFDRSPERTHENRESSTPKSHSPESGEINHNDPSKPRIFHQDAFCKMCDREFCNKYFLKTHMANKHGVYDSPLPLPNASQPGPLPTPFQLPLFFSQPGSLHPPPPDPMVSVSNPISMAMTMTPSMMPEKQRSPSMPEPSATGTNGNQNNSSSDMEDYCEICQKHFCNKYYLRKHKLDVHGIQMDAPLGNKRPGSRPDGLPMTSLGQSPMFVPQGIPSSMTNVMLINPFAPLMALPQNAANLLPSPIPQMPQHTPLKATQGGQTPSMPRESPILPRESPIQRRESPSQSRELTSPMSSNREAPEPGAITSPGGLSNESLRNIGVLNADSFCELCRKEFCNKYFLRIHKANKHGIFIDDEPIPPEYANIRSPQGTPVNLPAPENSNNNNTPKEPKNEPLNLNATNDSAEADYKKYLANIQNQFGQMHEPPAYCELCNKDFPNRYTLTIHRMNTHGAPGMKFDGSDDLRRRTPSAYEMEKFHQQMSHEQGLKAGLGNPDVPGMPTMFSSMIAAKLADRVTCDICNKEVCNKYFLKTHKLKMHGIEPSPGSTGSNGQKEQQSSLGKPDMTPEKPKAPEQKLKPLADQPQSPVVENMTPEEKAKRSEELLRMGIDPEAYCDICKKEFCSKYFLRTHKLNMHGIRIDGTPKEKEIKREDRPYRPPSPSHIPFSMANLMNHFSNFPQPPMSSQFNHSPIASHSTQSQYTQSPFPQQSMYSNSNQDSTKSDCGSDIGSNNGDRPRNKEPANMIRVKCDICQKELCNKYFLRTHKLNKHGIMDESLAGLPFKSNDPMRNLFFDGFFMNGRSPYPMEKGIKRESSSDGSAYPLDLKKQKLDLPEDSPGSVDSNQRSNNMSPSHDSQSDGSESRFMKYGSGIACHLCQRRFKSTKWLKTHLFVEHNIRDESLGEMGMEGGIQPCNICGMLFQDKTALHVHFIQEHQLPPHQMMQQMPPMPPMLPSPQRQEKGFVPFEKQSFSSNSSFGFGHSLNNLSLNLKRKYSKNLKQKLFGSSPARFGKMGRYTCNKCLQVFKFEHHLARHTTDCHSNKDNKSSQNGQGQVQRRFRCAHCHERFPTRIACKVHIRETHRHNSSQLPRKYQCEFCEYSTNFSNNLENHMRQKHSDNCKPNDNSAVNGDENDTKENEDKAPVTYAQPKDLKSNSSFIMQPFTVKDGTNMKQFVTSVVYLPVYRKINEPVNVTFELSPTEQ